MTELQNAIAGLLAAIRDAPHDRTHRMILADALEDAGDERAEIVRNIQPLMMEVASRLWPRCETVWVDKGRGFVVQPVVQQRLCNSLPGCATGSHPVGQPSLVREEGD